MSGKTVFVMALCMASVAHGQQGRSTTQGETFGGRQALERELARTGVAEPEKTESAVQAPAAQSDIQIPATAAGTATDKAPTQGGACYMVFCENEPSKCLMFEEAGTWMRGVRVVDMTITYPEEPKVTYQAWDGAFKPTNPRNEVRTVKAIRTVTPEAFQKFVDDLNSGLQPQL